MKKLLLIIPFFVLLSFFVSRTVFGGPPNPQLATVGPSQGLAVVVIPDHAIQVAPGVFNLGVAVIDGKQVEGFAFVDFVDYKKGYGKPGTECGNGICEPGENANKCSEDCGGNGGSGDTGGSSCYGFLAKDTKWKDIESYVVNASNLQGLSEAFVTSNMADNITKWKDAAGKDIIGNGSSTNDVLVADMISPDNVNEVYFADIDYANAIGVTIVWGIFRGPPSQRELVEWDQVYDDVDFDWSSTGELGKMDFESISTHELGHTVGLDDLYEPGCSQETMYGYADTGETEKRSLESGDIAGVYKLYN